MEKAFSGLCPLRKSTSYLHDRRADQDFYQHGCHVDSPGQLSKVFKKLTLCLSMSATLTREYFSQSKNMGKRI